MDGNDDTTQVVALSQPFPGYELKQELGVGGMARVYLAREESLDRLVAIKVMSEALLSDEFVERFASEARTAAQFRHPNIVVVHASGQSGDQPYIVFEYIGGGDLEQRINSEGALAEADALDIATKVAAALSYLHQRNVAHRDLKPGNILFNTDGSPVLADFGIAMDLAADSRLTRTGMSIGSPRYMSPEQLRGGKITAKSDMYSFGLVLLEMLGGRLPANVDPAEFLSRAGRHAPLVAELIAANPADRPSAEACVARLQSDSVDSTTTVSRGRYWFWAVAGISVVALVGNLTWVDERLTSESTVLVQITPADAKLYVNGKLLENRRMKVNDEPQELVVVAAGFAGESRQLSSATPAKVEFELEALGAPSAQQFRDFHDVFDNASLSSEQLQQVVVGYPLFDQLLVLRAGIAENSVVVSASLSSLAARADAGDAAAQVGGFLLASEGLADFSSSRTLLWLNNASARAGYSLASFYRALNFRQQQESIGSFEDAELVEYRNLLQLAKRQGLPFSRNELRSLYEATE